MVPRLAPPTPPGTPPATAPAAPAVGGVVESSSPSAVVRAAESHRCASDCAYVRTAFFGNPRRPGVPDGIVAHDDGASLMIPTATRRPRRLPRRLIPIGIGGRDGILRIGFCLTCSEQCSSRAPPRLVRDKADCWWIPWGGGVGGSPQAGDGVALALSLSARPSADWCSSF